MKLRIPYFWILAMPTILFSLGALCNMMVMSANHGMMPYTAAPWELAKLTAGGLIAPGMATDPTHKIMEHSDHLKILADWVTLPHIGQFSVGDGLLNLSGYVQDYFYGAWLALVARDSFKG